MATGSSEAAAAAAAAKLEEEDVVDTSGEEETLHALSAVASAVSTPDRAQLKEAPQGDGTMTNSDEKQQKQTSENKEEQNHVGGGGEECAALKEANEVLDSVGGQNHLNAFHLLGVVANPRGSTAIASATTTSPNSYHGRYDTTSSSTEQQAQQHGSTTSEMTFSNLFGVDAASYYYQSLESTISQMTGQMEDWSRYILEDETEQDKPESQLELPEHLQNLDLSSLNAYLEKSGSQAAAFQQIVQAAEHDELGGSRRRLMEMESSSCDTNTDNNNSSQKSDLVDTSDIPEIFFRKDFDLTDPDTFCKLLLSVDDNEGEGGSSRMAISENNDGPVHEWFPLVAQDALTAHEDKIELALLQQVRANSGKFFAESQRFAQLQEWIQQLLAQVVELQRTTANLQTDLLAPMETVPVADTQRADLRKLDFVLERADDMLLCKHGLGGVLSAHDDLTAIEQIQYGRRLLYGEVLDDNDDNESAYCVELGRLHSFKAVSDQLNEYEQLVVSNLRDELVEIFLSWNNNDSSAAGSSPVYGNGSSSSPANKASQQQLVHARVREIAGALRSCKSLSKTKDAYATRLQDVIRMTVRTTVGEFAADVAPTGAVQSVAMSTTAMALNRFLDCLDMLFEQLLALLTSAKGVDAFFVSEGFDFEPSVEDENGTQDKHRGLPETSASSAASGLATPLASVVVAAAELSSKSISELLRLRKDAHTLVTLEEMKSIWDSCMTFTLQLEEMSGSGHTSALRSTLLAQAKAFVERKHESNMSKLAAALDSERWVQCEVSAERQNGITRLCSGRAIVSSTAAKRASFVNADLPDGTGAQMKSQEIEAEGTRYKVVWSCLLLVEMILNDIATASHFPSLASSIVSKVAELLRLFNSRTTQLVLGAGAIHSHAKLKSINAKHLSLVTQCLGLIIAILPHIRAALMAQLPKKQHTLLTDLDQIRKEYGEHNEKVLNKFVTIIGGIVEHGLAKKIPGTDFDARAKSDRAADGSVTCCVFLEGVSTNTRKMHQVLNSLLPPDHLKDTFSRIFAFIDTKIPALFIAAANIQPVFQRKGSNGSPTKAPVNTQPTFFFPKTDEGKRQFLLEIELMTNNLNSLDGIHPWDFTVRNVVERRLEFTLEGGANPLPDEDPAADEDAGGSSDAGDNDDTENQLANGDVKGDISVNGDDAQHSISTKDPQDADSPPETTSTDPVQPVNETEEPEARAPPTDPVQPVDENEEAEQDINKDAGSSLPNISGQRDDVSNAAISADNTLSKEDQPAATLASPMDDGDSTMKVSPENGFDTPARVDVASEQPKIEDSVAAAVHVEEVASNPPQS